MTNKQTNFKCTHCGNGSLVRSNFKFSINNKPFCRFNSDDDDNLNKCEMARLNENSKIIKTEKVKAASKRYGYSK